LLPDVVSIELVAARNDPRRLEALVAKLPLQALVLIGYLLGFCVDLLASSMESEPEIERHLFCHMFAGVIIGRKQSVAKTEWIVSKESDELVATLECLLNQFSTIWRSALVPEKVVGEAPARSSFASSSSIQPGSRNAKTGLKPLMGQRKSLRRSSISADWVDYDNASGLVVLGPKEKKTVHSGVFLMDSSREPSGDVVDVAWVSVVFGTVEKHYPPMSVARLASLFVADWNRDRDAANLLETHNCQLVVMRPEGLSLPLASDVVPQPGTSLMLLSSGRLDVAVPASGKSSHSPDSALGDVSSVSPRASLGSGSSPSPTSTPSPPPLRIPMPAKYVPLRGRPDQISRRRAKTVAQSGVRPRSKSLEAIAVQGSANSSSSPLSPEEDVRVAPEKSTQLSPPEEELVSPVVPEKIVPEKTVHFPASKLKASLQSSPSLSNMSPTSGVKDLRTRSFSINKPIAKQQSGELHARGASTTESTTPPTKMSLRLTERKESSEAMRHGTRATSVSSDGGTTPREKLSMMKRLIGKKKGPQPPLPDSPNCSVLWNSVKLVVVGQENVGKTHLCRQMENSKYETNISTDGIEIGSWNTGKGKNLVSFITLDFGGQEIFYPTHQFFLTSRCVYIIAFRVDKDDYMDRVMYWVRTIEQSVQYSSSPPIVLVGTHRDDPSVTEARLAAIHAELEVVARKCRLIKDILFVSCTKGTNIQQLKGTLMQVSVSARLALEPVPRFYVDLWEALTEASMETPFCSFKEYRDMAQNLGVPMEAFNVVTRFLHDVGRLIYFGSSDSQQLSDTVVLDPGWLAARMSDIISFKQSWSGGVVDRARLQIVWKQYDQRRQDEMLSLLERFQVVFFTRGRNVTDPALIIVPSLLPESVDLSVVAKGLTPALALMLRRRIYNFNWIPLGFSARLVALFHNVRHFKVSERWRRGLVLSNASDPTERGLLGKNARKKFFFRFFPFFFK
jgi:GTPase SAR1 family protein